MTVYKHIKTPTEGYKRVINRKVVGFIGILLALYLGFLLSYFF